MNIEKEINDYLRRDDSTVGWISKESKEKIGTSDIPNFKIKNYNIEIKYESEDSVPDFPQINISLKRGEVDEEMNDISITITEKTQSLNEDNTGLITPKNMDYNLIEDL